MHFRAWTIRGASCTIFFNILVGHLTSLPAPRNMFFRWMCSYKHRYVAGYSRNVLERNNRDGKIVLYMREWLTVQWQRPLTSWSAPTQSSTHLCSRGFPWSFSIKKRLSYICTYTEPYGIIWWSILIINFNHVFRRWSLGEVGQIVLILLEQQGNLKSSRFEPLR